MTGLKFLVYVSNLITMLGSCIGGKREGLWGCAAPPVQDFHCKMQKSKYGSGSKASALVGAFQLAGTSCEMDNSNTTAASVLNPHVCLILSIQLSHYICSWTADFT